MVRHSVRDVMVLDDGTLAFSASDLSAAAACEFAVLRTLDGLLGRGAPVRAAADVMLERVARLGGEHEQRVLRALVREHGVWSPGASGGVAQLARPEHYDVRDEPVAGHHRTVELLRDGPDVLYQAGFFDGRFVGWADFLVRTADGWQVVDAKLARNAAVVAVLQLAAYADQLERAGVTLAPTVRLVLGDGSSTEHRLADVVPVYRQRRARLQALLDGHRLDDGPVVWGDQRFNACGRCDVCAPEAAAARDLLLVAGVFAGQREKLQAAGIRTIDELAAGDGPVPGMSDGSVRRLRLQARLQVAQEHGAVGVGLPEGAGVERGIAVALVDPDGVAATLPPPDPGDIFFDFEGDPLWYDAAAAGSDAWGLEYLFGVVELPSEPGAEPVFRPFWAHSRAEEREALVAFLDYLDRRRAEHPGMHVYHYAPYERVALLRLAGRHGVGEAAVDALLREGVLVDLYASVRAGVRTGQPSYSLKQLEPLYMPEHRTGEVTTAAASIVEYAEAVAARDAGRLDEWRARVEEIGRYNEYDCLSTLGLRDWLLAHLAAAGRGPARAVVTGPVGAGPVSGRPVSAGPRAAGLVGGAQVGAGVGAAADDERALAEAELAALEQRLMDAAGPGPGEGVEREPDRQAIALVAAALRYHRREELPFWWAHFDRLSSEPADWTDRRNTFVAEAVEVQHRWSSVGRQLPRRRLTMTGRLEPGSELRPGSAVYGLYDPPVPVGAHGSVDGSRGWRTQLLVLDVAPQDGHDVLLVEERLGRQEARFDEVPMALVPAPGPGTGPLRDAVRTLAEQVAESLPGLPGGAATDLARRRAPQDQGRRDLVLPRAEGPDDLPNTLVKALHQLGSSYLAVQGPPGTGKTYTGARVIADLVAEGWRVGVVAQSHAVVENLLRCVAAAGVDPAAIGKQPSTEQVVAHGGPDPQAPWTWLRSDAAIAEFEDGDGGSGWVLGGTAWTFTNRNRLPDEPLDLLVVDEAGQFSLANTFAVAGAARRLLLLGDPQQLPQVSQGTHPEPVDHSALGWLMDGAATLPERYGYFLADTWRMHPALCAAVSRLSYDDRLRSAPAASRRSLSGVEPGVHGLLVEHGGNAVRSAAEAAVVADLVRDLVGRWWTDPGDADAPTGRPLRPEDVLVVAAYNAQVSAVNQALAEAGLHGVPVGTVDKFQGRQAAVAILTTAASSPVDVRRGMGFLLNRNRLNVAVSRGQWCSFVVRSTALTDYLPGRPAQLAELGAFIALSTAHVVHLGRSVVPVAF